jgi:hypothetical protein
MALIRQDRTAQEEADLKAHQTEVAELKQRLATNREAVEHGFIEGAITRDALHLEMTRLDVFRRTTNPVDQSVQSLVQGQQNEIEYLLNLEKTLLTEQENLIQRLNEAEAELQVLVEAKQRRSKKHA